MALIRRKDDDLFHTLDRAFGRDFFDRAFGTGLSRFADGQKLAFADWAPAVDVAEDDKGYHIHADLPKVSKDDVTVAVEHGILTIAGERKLERSEDDAEKKFHRVERAYGKFQRSFQVPEDVDADAVQATFKDGVLEVFLPKAPKGNGRRTIAIS